MKAVALALGLAETADESEVVAKLNMLRTELALLHDERASTLAMKTKLEEDEIIRAGKARGAIALGFDEAELRAWMHVDPTGARKAIELRPNGSRTPVGLGRDSAPPALRPEDLPANQQPRTGEVTDADLDAGLMRLGIKPDRIASMKARWKECGMSDADIRKQLLAMSTPVSR